MTHSKHEILQRTGATSDQYDRAAKRYFGEVVYSVPEIWIAKFLQTLTNRIH
jgi:hypothetical protein